VGERFTYFILLGKQNIFAKKNVIARLPKMDQHWRIYGVYSGQVLHQNAHNDLS
jgi:hypothetical protein